MNRTGKCSNGRLDKSLLISTQDESLSNSVTLTLRRLRPRLGDHGSLKEGRAFVE